MIASTLRGAVLRFVVGSRAVDFDGVGDESVSTLMTAPTDLEFKTMASEQARLAFRRLPNQRSRVMRGGLPLVAMLGVPNTRSVTL